MYILTQQGDKMAKEGKLILQIGAWASNTILGLIGIYFLRISLNDSRLFESDFYQVTWQRLKAWIIKNFKNKPGETYLDKWFSGTIITNSGTETKDPNF